jgi:hypothetical protein
VALGPIPLRRQPGCLIALKKRLPASIGSDPGSLGVDIFVCTDQTFGFDEYCGDVEDGVPDTGANLSGAGAIPGRAGIRERPRRAEPSLLPVDHDGDPTAGRAVTDLA